jgi:hypothetical protein
MDLKEIGLETVDWNHLVQDRNRWRDYIRWGIY